MDDQHRYERARRRVQEIRGFYIHLTVYIVVNVGLFLLNIAVSPGTLWFYWSLLGWGIGLALHGLSVFGFGRWLGKDWEERTIRKMMDEDERRNP